MPVRLGAGPALLAGVLLVLQISVACGQNASDARARNAIIGALTGNDDAIRQAYNASLNQPAPSGGIPPADAVYYLYNCTRTSREEFLAGQEILAANTKDKEWQRRIITSLLTDEVYELNRLEGQNRFNKYTRIFNKVSTSLSQLILLQPQAAASLIWDGIYGFRKAKDTTVKERKMIYLSDQFLKKYPQAPERADVTALRLQLQQKMMAERARALVEAGKTAISEGKFQLAEWHLEKAAILTPADAATKQMLDQARALRTRSEEVIGLTLGVSQAESQLNDVQSKAVGDTARALLLGKTSAMNETRQKIPGMWDSVDYAFAALSEKSGDHTAALQRLQSVASSAPNTPGGRASVKLLDNPNYNLSESYQKALADMASDQKHFIWTGRRTKDDTVYSAGSAVIQNAANPVAVPVLFGLDAAVRAVSENFRTQVSVDGVIDAGARYRRRYPKSPQSVQIAQQLAELSRKAGDYRRTRTYLEESGGGTPEEIAKLSENEARAKYEELTQSTDLIEKRDLLDDLLKNYPNTKIVQKNAAKEQAKLPPTLAQDTIVLPAKALQRDPNLAQSLGIPAYLVDNSKGNGELTDDGVAITPSANAVQFKIQKESQWRQAPLASQNRETILTAARQLRLEYMNAAKTKDDQYRQRLPFAVDGGVGSGGIDAAPQILPYPVSDKDKQRFN